MTKTRIASDFIEVVYAACNATNLLEPGSTEPLRFPTLRLNARNIYAFGYLWPLVQDTQQLIWISPKSYFDDPEILNALRLICLQKRGRIKNFRMIFPLVNQPITRMCATLDIKTHAINLKEMARWGTENMQDTEVRYNLAEVYMASISFIIHNFLPLYRDCNFSNNEYFLQLLTTIHSDFENLGFSDDARCISSVIAFRNSDKSGSNLSQSIESSLIELKNRCDKVTMDLLKEIKLAC